MSKTNEPPMSSVFLKALDELERIEKLEIDFEADTITNTFEIKNPKGKAIIHVRKPH